MLKQMIWFNKHKIVSCSMLILFLNVCGILSAKFVLFIDISFTSIFRSVCVCMWKCTKQQIDAYLCDRDSHVCSPDLITQYAILTLSISLNTHFGMESISKGNNIAYCRHFKFHVLGVSNELLVEMISTSYQLLNFAFPFTMENTWQQIHIPQWPKHCSFSRIISIKLDYEYCYDIRFRQ